VEEIHRIINARVVDRIGGRENPRERVIDALAYRIASDPRWAEDPITQRLIAELTPEEHVRLRQLARPRRLQRAGAQEVEKVIARDQVIYEACARKEWKVEAKILEVTSKLGLAPRWGWKIYGCYQRQADRLLGLGVRQPRTVLAEAARRRFPITASRLRLQPTCRDLDEALHWFAHALRNLSRWLNRHPPLAWRDCCRAACLRHRDRLSQ
jgi:hypothetical protein